MALVVKICLMCKARPQAPRTKMGICVECRIRRKLDANARHAERRKRGEVYTDESARIIEAALAAMDRRSWHGRFRCDRGMDGRCPGDGVGNVTS